MNQQSSQRHVNNLVVKLVATSTETHVNYIKDRFVTIFKPFISFCQRKNVKINLQK